jgi:hypothetical protein
MGIIAGKPSRDFTRPLRMPRGLKVLLHMLNAIISPTKVDLCFLFLLCFHFCFSKGLAKCKFVVFDQRQILYI